MAKKSKYFRQLPNESDHGDAVAVVEQLFPPVGEGEVDKLIGKSALDALKSKKKVIVTKAADRSTVSLNSSTPETYDPANPRLEVSTRLGDTFELDGWELLDDGEELVNQIDAHLGVTGLTIVLERGIIERPVTQVQLAD